MSDLQSQNPLNANANLVGIGMNNQLFTRKNYLTSNWEHIPNSGAVLAITAMPDGTLVGIGMNNQLYTRKTLTSNWEHIPNSGAVLGIAYYPAVRQPVPKPFIKIMVTLLLIYNRIRHLIKLSLLIVVDKG